MKHFHRKFSVLNFVGDSNFKTSLIRPTITFFLLLVVFFFQAQAQRLNSSNGKYVTDEILVKLKPNASGIELGLVNSKIGGKLVKEIGESGWQLIRLPRGKNAAQTAAEYKRLSEAIENAQPNFIYTPTVVRNDPNDLRFNELYGMEKIKAPDAWSVTTGSPSVVVAVIDTGIKYTHEDLAANMWKNPGETGLDSQGNDKATNGIDDDTNGYVDDVYGYDFYNHNANPFDEYNHGTHVAGTIGAVGNNSLGVVGVNWNVRLMDLKIFNQAGQATTAGVVEAFDYARIMKQRGVNVVVTNNSYGGPPEVDPSEDQAVKDAIDRTGQANILNVFAAGNNARNNETNPFYPAGFNSPSILAVASSDSSDNKSSFSNYGANVVDLAAPGSSILSTVIGSDNSSYAYFNGTSMATPHVAGAAALLAAQYPSLSAASLKATLMNTVDVLQQWSGLVKTGGRLNVSNAIASPSACSFNLSSTAANFPVSGGSGSFNITTGPNCDATAFTSASWITVTSNPTSGNGVITFTVAPNNTNAQRTAQLDVAGQTFTVTQNFGSPTAATVSIGGRVLSPSGKPVRGVMMTLTEPDGNIRSTITGAFGYYRFTDVAAGNTIVIAAASKQYVFAPQFLNVTEALSDFNFNAQ